MAIHPICHRMLHKVFGNAELARLSAHPGRLREDPAIARFLAWIANKPPDFHAPTAKGVR